MSHTGNFAISEIFADRQIFINVRKIAFLQEAYVFSEDFKSWSLCKA